MAHPILNYGQYLNLREDDPRLRGLVESFGRRFRIQRDDQYGDIPLKRHGLEIRFKKEEWLVEDGEEFENLYRLIDIGFYAGGYEGYREYAGGLIDGATFSTSRAEIRLLLGQPIASGGGNKVSGFVLKEWDQFQLGDFFVGFRYSDPGGSICTINLTLPQFCRS
jgi:hypothetical protein